MKKLSTFVLTGLFAASVFAQGNANTSVASASSSNSKTKGLTIGLIYSNLSEIRVKGEGRETRNGVTEYFNDSAVSGTHAGMAGLDIGYKNSTAFTSFGYNSSLAIQRNMNKSEINNTVTIYAVKGNLVYPIKNIVNLSAGLNVAQFTFEENVDTATITPGLGGQIGIEANINNVGILLGYQSLGLNAKNTESGMNYDYESKIQTELRGFITQISYTF